MRHFRYIKLIILLLLLSPGLLKADYYTLETDNLKLIYYGNAQGYLIPHIVRCFENSLQKQKEIFNYKSSEKITLLLHDHLDYHNAGVRISPKNLVMLSVAPPNYAFEVVPSNEQINATLHHELTHIAADDKGQASDKFFRSLFNGKVNESLEQPLSILYSYLTTPRRLTPVWYREGTAVFMETWMSGGLGRAMGSYDEMVFRTAIHDEVPLYDRICLESNGTESQFLAKSNSYLYGTRFISYLSLKYDPESVIRWVSRSDSSYAYFSSQFEKIFSSTIDAEWDNWVEWEVEFQHNNLENIRSNPITQFRDIGTSSLGSVSKGVYDNSKNILYTAVNYPGEIAFIAGIDLTDGSINKITEIKNPANYSVTSISYDQTTNTLFYTTDNNQWRDICSYNTLTGEKSTLIRDARIGDLVYNDKDKSIWGIRHFNGITTLVRVPPPYNKWHQVTSLPYGQNLHGIDISSDGKYISAGLSHINGQQTLVSQRITALLSGDTTFNTLFDFGHSIPINFIWTDDNRYLIGTSYYSGVSNVFRYDLEQKQMEAISNCETGFFNPVQISEDSILVFKYNTNGFNPVIIPIRAIDGISSIEFLGQKIVENHPIVKNWTAPSPGDINFDTLNIKYDKYRGWKNIQLSSIYPVVEGYREWPAYGARIEMGDPAMFHNLTSTISYTPNSNLPEKERYHFELDYSQINFLINYKHNDADFYDLFGPTKTSRKGSSLRLGYRNILLYDLPRVMNYQISLTNYWSLKKLPEYQNITTSFDKFVSLDYDLVYKHYRSSIGAVDYEKGHHWRLSGSNRYVNRKLFSQFRSEFGTSIPLFINHSSIGIRTVIGISPNRADEPLANFYFGGFGNNWVDYQIIQRYRTWYSFPGIDLNSVGGRNFIKAQWEWSLPPLRFNKVGIPMFYATWVRTSIFSSGLITNLDKNEYKRSLLNAGIQMDIRMKFLSTMNMTLSIGSAVAFEKYKKPSGELMISFKLL